MLVKDETTGKEYDCYLGDDGTLDTVIIVNGREVTFGQEWAGPYRDPDTGELTTEGFVELCQDCFEDLWQFED